jgi:hypothetical protein
VRVLARTAQPAVFLSRGALKRCYWPGNSLQRDRILWTQAWLDALDDPEDSEAETVVGEENY